MLRRLLLAALVPAVALAADAPTTPQRFGAAITVKRPVDIARLAGASAKFTGKTVPGTARAGTSWSRAG